MFSINQFRAVRVPACGTEQIVEKLLSLSFVASVFVNISVQALWSFVALTSAQVIGVDVCKKQDLLPETRVNLIQHHGKIMVWIEEVFFPSLVTRFLHCSYLMK